MNWQFLLRNYPTWFQSGEFSTEPEIFTPPFSLELEPITVPEYDAGYIIIIGNWSPDYSPGGACLLAVEKAEHFTLYKIYDNFSDSGFYPGMGGSLDCFAKDATEDGVDEIIVDHWVGGRVGYMEVHIFDTSALPPKALPFTPARNDYLSPDGFDWDLFRSDDFKIHAYTEFGLCDFYKAEDYQWNGKWFEVSKTQIDYRLTFDVNQKIDFNCGNDISSMGNELTSQDMISIADQAVISLSPGVFDLPQKHDELSILKGIYHAFIGDRDTAQSVFNEIVNLPTTPDSPWIPAAQNALAVYKGQADLYKMCSAIDICVDYFTQFMGDPDLAELYLSEYLRLWSGYAGHDLNRFS